MGDKKKYDSWSSARMDMPPIAKEKKLPYVDKIKEKANDVLQEYVANKGSPWSAAMMSAAMDTFLPETNYDLLPVPNIVGDVKHIDKWLKKRKELAKKNNERVKNQYKLTDESPTNNLGDLSSSPDPDEYYKLVADRKRIYGSHIDVPKKIEDLEKEIVDRKDFIRQAKEEKDIPWMHAEIETVDQIRAQITRLKASLVGEK